MRQIAKHPEPSTLTRHRQQANADYDNHADKQGLRSSLHAEQYALCCYCMQRIRDSEDAMKIEHWQCRRHHPANQLQYWNLLGACTGNKGRPSRDQHCDTSKADQSLSRNPANSADAVEDVIRYLGDGRVESSDKQFDKELNEVLNLNVGYLVDNRRAVLDGFKDALGKRGALTEGQIHKKLGDWSTPTNGELREYCGVVIYWLNKRLARV